MDNDILQSIIDFTKHRDLDSLEYSLVGTLAEIVAAEQISIYKVFTTPEETEIEEALCLDMPDKISGKERYQWTDKSRVIENDSQLELCIEQVEPSSHELEDGRVRLLIPLSNDTNAIGAISIIGDDSILESLNLVMGFIKIYDNYQIILEESEHDKLTGLFNRQTFDKKLGRLLKSQHNRNNEYAESGQIEKRQDPAEDASAWLVVLDFDGFKQINDTYGHIYGDEVLLILSQKMKESFRKSDLLFRFGGDEFVIILEPVTFEKALDALERFRVTVSAHHFPQIGKITISTGFARIGPRDYPPAVLEKADKALYYAKQNGRNCTFNYEELVETGRLKEQKTSGAIDLF